MTTKIATSILPFEYDLIVGTTENIDAFRQGVMDAWTVGLSPFGPPAVVLWGHKEVKGSEDEIAPAPVCLLVQAVIRVPPPSQVARPVVVPPSIIKPN